MRVPPSSLQTLRARKQIARSDIDALAKQAGADPKARAQLALDVLTLGPRLDAEAAAFARSLVVEKPSASPVATPAEIPLAFSRDAATLTSPAAATLLLSAHVDQLAQQTTNPAERDQVASKLLTAATQTAVVGDPDRAEGDPWSAREWTETAPGWADTAPWGRLVAILDARGLRPASVPRQSAQSGQGGEGWWSELSAPSALYRSAQVAEVKSGAGMRQDALQDALVALGAGWTQSAPFTTDDVKRVLEG